MFCPRCVNKLNIFVYKCLKCEKSFKNMSLVQRQKLGLKQRNKPVKSSQKIEPTPIRITYDNGIPAGEGMSMLEQNTKEELTDYFYTNFEVLL